MLIKDAPKTAFAGYPANRKAGYRISGAPAGLLPQNPNVF
jgi:hypothetical protein